MSFKKAKVHAGVTDPAIYHAQEFERGDAKLPMSPSSLKAFGQCAARWRAGYTPPDSPAKDFGSLLDCRALTPDLFETRYAVHPLTYEAKGMECPKCKSVTDAKTCGKCKCDRVEIRVTKDWNWNAEACADWKLKQGTREIISPDDMLESGNALAALFKDEVIKSFLEASRKQVLVTAEWHDEATKLVVPVRCLIDLVPRLDSEFPKSLGDLKTTRSAALHSFTRFSFNMGYYIQAAFDLDIYMAATGEDRCNWCFVLQENYPPFQTGKRLASMEFLSMGRAEYRRQLANYCWCLKNGKWPGYDDTDDSIQGWSLIEPEPWMQEQTLREARFSAPVPPPGEEENFDLPP